MQQTHETSSAVNCYWPTRTMQQTLDPIVIGQQEQCNINPTLVNTMVNCYWPTRAMQQTHKTSSAVNCYWPTRTMQQTLDPIVIGQQEQYNCPNNGRKKTAL